MSCTKSGTTKNWPWTSPLLLFLLIVFAFSTAFLLLFIGYQQSRLWQLASIQQNGGHPTGMEMEMEAIKKRAKRSHSIDVNEGNDDPILEYAVNEPPKFLAPPKANLVLGEPQKSAAAADSTISFPLFAQFSEKALRKFCLEKFKCERKEEEEEGGGGGQKRREKNRTTGNGRREQRKRKKVCPPIHSFGPAQLVGHRIHSTGSAIRRGNRWFLTEYGIGYALFQFDLASNGSEGEKWKNAEGGQRQEEEAEEDEGDETDSLAFPSQIHTLPEPFRGTDHTIAGPFGHETFVYQLASGEGRVQALNLHTGRRLTKLIYADKAPLYGFGPRDGGQKQEENALSSASSIDIEVDQQNSAAIWLIFRPPPADHSAATIPRLSILKLASGSLKELGQWELDGIDPGKLVNAFVACGILYKVELAANEDDGEGGGETDGPKELAVTALFDFEKQKYVAAKPIRGWTATGPRSTSNVQYDPETDSLSVFDGGKVLNVPLIRG